VPARGGAMKKETRRVYYKLMVDGKLMDVFRDNDHKYHHIIHLCGVNIEPAQKKGI
jgi:hypothetical protein